MTNDCKCGTQFCKHHKAQVWSCGGGTQSCAIAALIVQGKLPKPDFSVIADTGYETGATWEFMDRVLVPELEKVDVKLCRILASVWGEQFNKLFSRNGDCWMPAYTTQNGIGKLPAFCSDKWKVTAMNRWFGDTMQLRPSQRCRWIGFSRDEQRRILRMQQGDDFKKGLIRFPLLEHGLTRRDCIALVESMGWGTPPRSSCYMCPNHSDHEWRKLISERPDEFQKAVEIEREIHKVDPDAWLHRSCVPLDQVDFSQPEDLFSRPCDSGMCFV